MVHNLICGSFTSVGGGCDWIVEDKLRQRFTPYHIPHRTEVMGFQTILHGDDRFYNNIFVQKYPAEDITIRSDSEEKYFSENRKVGTEIFNDYVTYDEWVEWFELDNDTPDMKTLEKYHYRSLPVWVEGNAYLAGAVSYKNEKKKLINPAEGVFIELEEKDGKTILKTNLYDYIKDFHVGLITSDVLGEAFEPEERYENPDGSDIIFNSDYAGEHRDLTVIPGPFACEVSERVVY